MEMLKTSHKNERIKWGLTLTGLSNVLCGFFGVIGFVNYTLSPGVIMSTKCASRFTLVPASIILFLLSFFPTVIGFIGKVPSSVTGAILAFVLTLQVAAGLMVALKDHKENDFQIENGMVIGLSILLGTMVAFMPREILNQMPLSFRPILGNGFVIGTLSAIILEHMIFRR
jgi:xanthine/uracil permease